MGLIVNVKSALRAEDFVKVGLRRRDFIEDLNNPLLELSRGNFWTGVDATSHTHFFGRTGGGKTSAAKWLAGAMLRAGWGALITAVKPEDIALWKAYAKEHGRGNSLLLFDGENETLNFLEYLIRVNGMDGIGTVTECLMKIFEAARRASGGASNRGGDEFWNDAARQVLRYAIPVLYSATGTLSIPDIIRFITTAPASVKEVKDRAWQDRSLMYKVMDTACQRPIVPMARSALQDAINYWSEQFCSIPDKTRGNVIITITTVLDRFNHGRLRRAFTEGSTVVPELTFGGGLLLGAMPTTIWQEDGVIAQSLLKFLWQRAVISRNNLAPQHRERPVFLWCDEAQETVSSYDGEFLSICRSSKCAVVYLSQTLPGYIAKIGGDSPRDAALGLVGKFATHVLMSNLCPETNEFAARVVGRVVKRRGTYNKGSSESVNIGMNAGNSENSGSSSSFSTSYGQGGVNSTSGSSDGSGNSWGENRGRGTSRNVSEGYSESMEYAIEPGDFGRILKTGGPRNGNEVTAIWYQAGRVFTTGTNFLLARFKQ
jgi:hypothetical protein